MSDRKFIYKGYYLAENGMSFAGDIGIYANQDYNKGVYWFDNDTNDTLFELRTRDGLSGKKELFLTSESGLMRFVPPVVFEDDVIYKGELIDPYFDFFKGDYFTFNKQALFTEDVSIQQGKSIYWFAGENNKRFFNMQVKTIDDDCQLVFCSDTATSYINFALPVMFSGDVAYKDEFLDTILDRKLEAADLEDYALRSEVNAKQDQLTDGQLLAVNSGITTSHITKYDAYATSKADASDLTTHTSNATVHITAAERTAWNGKQDALNSDQLAAANSGITSTKLTSINSKLEALEGSHFIVVDTLPATGATNTIYLTPSAKTAEKNIKDEYIYVNNAWEKIGSTDIDLSDYLKSADAANTYQTKLSEAQLNAANSGITSTKVTKYDTFFDGDTYSLDKDTYIDGDFSITQGKSIYWFAGEDNTRFFNTKVVHVEDGYQLIYCSDGNTSYINFDTPVRLSGDVCFRDELLDVTLDRKLEATDLEAYALKTDLNAKQDKLSTGQLAAANSGITASKVTAYDGYATTIAGKQTALNSDQLAAVNSGITSTKVNTYDGYATTIGNKQDKLTDTQLAAVNSGITSTKVTTYDNFLDGDIYDFDKESYFEDDLAIMEGKGIYWFASDNKDGAFFDMRVQDSSEEDGKQLVVCSDSSTSYINFAVPVKFSGSVSYNGELLEDLLDNLVDKSELAEYTKRSEVERYLAGKQDTLIAGDGIKITGDTISVDDTPKAPLMLPVYDRYMLNCDGGILTVDINDDGIIYEAALEMTASNIADILNSSNLPPYIEAYTNGTVLIIDVTQPGHRNITVTENNWGYEFEHFTWPDGITLKHKAVYTIPVINSTLDISGYELEKYGTTEIWLDFVSGSVITGSNWVWTSGSSPSTWSSNKRYCLVLRNDGLRTLANIDYSYTCSKSDNPIFSATPIIRQ